MLNTDQRVNKKVEKTIMRILYITDYLPAPPISGDRIRVFNLIKQIAKHHQVTLVALFPTSNDPAHVSALSEFCEKVEIAYHQWPNPIHILPDLMYYFLSGKPLELRLLYSKKLVDMILQLIYQQDFDVVQIEHSRMALYLDALPFNEHRRSLLTFHNVGFDQYKRISKIEKRPVEKVRTWFHSKIMQYWEPRYAERFDRSIAVSDIDRDILLEVNPRLQIDVIPNGIDTVKFQLMESDRNSLALLFIGSMSYSPCADGAVYFCTCILPFIQQRLKDVEVWIVGANPTPEVLALAADRIHVTGFVEDILPYYRRAAVSIVPLRAGGGTRLKILESMALGRPIVSTAIGCEGLSIQDGQHLLVADEPQEFAERIVRLLTDHTLYQNIVNQARELAVTRYDWNVIGEQLLDVYENVTEQESNVAKTIQSKEKIEK